MPKQEYKRKEEEDKRKAEEYKRKEEKVGPSLILHLHIIPTIVSKTFLNVLYSFFAMIRTLVLHFLWPSSWLRLQHLVPSTPRG